MSDNKNILLINDLSGFGKVALSAMIPVLSAFGYNVSNLPTAVVSNTLDYGKFNILDTTKYMEGTVSIWKELNFHFDCICTGFICQRQQIDIIEKVIEDNANAFVLVDPIMGDDGHLYNGIDYNIIQSLRKLISLSDLLIPNLTEAELLVFGETNIGEHSDEYYRDILKKLRIMGAKSIVISSIKEDDDYYIYGMEKGEIFRIQYDYIDTRFPGTGDVFSAVLLGNLMKKLSLRESTEKAAIFLHDSIRNSQNQSDHWQGLKVEQLLKNYDL